jgi:hypothetical protein
MWHGMHSAHPSRHARVVRTASNQSEAWQPCAQKHQCIQTAYGGSGHLHPVTAKLHDKYFQQVLLALPRP